MTTTNRALPFVAMAYVTTKLIALLLLYKVVKIFSIHAAASTLVIPLWFCLGDVITEVYGYKIAKRLVWMSVLCQLVFGWLPISLNLLPAGNISSLNQSSYTEVIAHLPQGATASFLAIVIGGIVNAFILNKWKLKLHGKYFFLRSFGSTAIGELIFTVCVYLIGFHGFASLSVIFKLILVSYLLKLVINPIMIIPISILARFLKNYENPPAKDLVNLPVNAAAKYTTLYSNNGNTYFVDQDIKLSPKYGLGLYSKDLSAKSFVIRNIDESSFLNWHTVQNPQYAIYLSGEMEIEVSSGEIRRFKAGDILFFNDLLGKGHLTRTISPGQAIIIQT